VKKENNLIVNRFLVGPLGVNCYVLADAVTKEACLVDPGAEPEKIEAYIVKQGFDPKFIINTHGHGDHIAANGYFSLPVYIHRLDAPLLGDPERNISAAMLFPVVSPPASRLLEDGDKIKLGLLTLDIIHTPGHTEGSISIKVDGVIFTGDTLFNASIGRTDLDGGDENAILRSISEKLLIYSDDTVIYPGHGEASTIGRERKSNPFLGDQV